MSKEADSGTVYIKMNVFLGGAFNEMDHERHVANTIVHEATHRILGTNDWFYYDSTMYRELATMDARKRSKCRAERLKWQLHFHNKIPGYPPSLSQGCELLKEEDDCPLKFTDDCKDFKDTSYKCPFKCWGELGPAGKKMTPLEQSALDFDIALSNMHGTLAGSGFSGAPVLKPKYFGQMQFDFYNPYDHLIDNADSLATFAIPDVPNDNLHLSMNFAPIFMDFLVNGKGRPAPSFVTETLITTAAAAELDEEVSSQPDDDEGGGGGKP